MIKKLIFTTFLLIAFALNLNVLVYAANTGATNNKTPITTLKCNQFTFDATGSKDPDNESITYYWDLGDGNTSTEPIVTHTYQNSGDFNVTLTITDNSGLDCSTANTTQTVRVNIPPFATFNSDDYSCVNQDINFDASKSRDESSNQLSYTWDFGDGTRSNSGPTVVKNFSKGGTYKVSLSVDDNSNTVCNNATVEKTIHINEPPVAEAGEDVILKCVGEDADLMVTFDASNSFDANKDDLIYLWDFGDGNRKEGLKVNHKYSKIGNYDVKLIVKDNTNLGCSTGVDFVTVKLNEKPKADAGKDIIGCVGQSLIFDGQNSYTNKKGTSTYKWFFGDGQSSDSLTTQHIYAKAGKFDAILSMENKLNPMCPPSRDTKVVTINSRPSVELSAKTSACLGEIIEFDASLASDPDDDPLEYYWSFGDGSILKSGPKVTHEYKQGGQYRATVIVDDNKGSECSTATAKLDIRINTPPIADAGPNSSCCVDLISTFDGSGSSDPDGDKLSYTWDFGDGSKTDGAVVNHAYKNSGSHNVILTVDDNSGTSCSKTSSGFVAMSNASPLPIINIR